MTPCGASSGPWHRVGGIRAAQAWDITPTGGVAVAVIDTGIRSHPDLDSKRLSGYDMIRDTFISNDDDGRDSDPTDAGDYDDSLACTWLVGFRELVARHSRRLASSPRAPITVKGLPALP